MTIKCSTSSNPQPTPVEKPKGSPLRAKIRQFYDGLREVSGVVTSKQEFEAIMSEKFTTLAASVAEIPKLDRYNWLESKLSVWFGMKSWLWQASDLGRTTAGKVNDLLSQRMREASQLTEYMGVYKAIPTIRKLSNELQLSLPTLSKVQLQELLHDHIVIGQFPRLKNIYDSPVVHAQLNARYQAHMNKLLELGLSPEQVQKLDSLSGEISSYFDNARMLVGKYGLDIKQMQNGGYFPLQLNDDAKRLVEAALETSLGNRSKQVFDTADVINKSRNSMIPIVVDLPEMAKLLKTSELELAFLITEPGALSEHLAKFSPDELESLFNRGILAQTPALSDELVTFFNEGLDLPISGMGEAIWLDPIKAIENYNNQLKGAVENASLIQTALEEGAKQGWVLDTIEYTSLSPELRKSFVKIGDNKLLQDLVRSNNLRETIAEGYIHKTVADQVRALYQINTSFETLGLFGAGAQQWLKVVGEFKRGALLSASIPGMGYVKRVFGQNFFALLAGGGKQAAGRYAMGLADTTKVLQKKTLDVLSDAKNISIGGKTLSEQDLMFNFFIRSGGDFSTVAGERVRKQSFGQLWERFQTESLQRFWKFSKLYGERYGLPGSGQQIVDAAGLAGEIFGKTYRGLYEQLAFANQFSDFAAQWTLLKTIVQDPSAAGKQEWKDLDEALRYTKEYFGINENPGTVGKAVGQFLAPFAQFALVAPGSMARHALRHPWRYARMMKLYSQAQAASGGQLTDAELAQYQKDRYTLFVGRGTDGKLWAVNPGSWDFHLDVSDWAKENFEKLGRSAGLPLGSTVENVDKAMNPASDLQASIQETFEKFYFSKAIQAAIVGTDWRNKEQFNPLQEDTLVGIPMSQQLRAVLIDTLPILRSLDRSLPASVVGRAAQVDNLYNVSDPGQAGFLGRVPTQGGNKTSANPSLLKPQDLVAWIAETGGLTIQQIDPENNTIKNYKDLGKRIDDIREVKGRLLEISRTQPNRPDLQQVNERLRYLQQLEGAIIYQRLLIDKLALEKGYTPDRALQKIRAATRKQLPNTSLLEYLRVLEATQEQP